MDEADLCLLEATVPTGDPLVDAVTMQLLEEIRRREDEYKAELVGLQNRISALESEVEYAARAEEIASEANARAAVLQDRIDAATRALEGE